MAGAARSGRRTRLTRPQLALAMIVAGTAGRIALAQLANIETVLAASMLAGVVLRGWYVAFVPIAIMAVSDVALYAMGIGGAFGLTTILGVSAFTWSGFLMVSAIGTRVDRSRILFRVRSIAVLTAISVPATILYDLWTDVGEWYFIAAPRGITFLQVLAAQVPFTLIHIASSLIFVPLFGTAFIWLYLHDLPAGGRARAPAEDRAPSE